MIYFFSYTKLDQADLHSSSSPFFSGEAFLPLVLSLLFHQNQHSAWHRHSDTSRCGIQSGQEFRFGLAIPPRRKNCYSWEGQTHSILKSYHRLILQLPSSSMSPLLC